MADRVDCRADIAAALSSLADGPLPGGGGAVFGAMGYRSDRTLPMATAREFIVEFDAGGRLTENEREALGRSSALHLLFQLTDDELAVHGDMFKSSTELRPGDFNSYLFFDVELPARPHTRTELSGLVRTINKPLAMPALVLFRHGEKASLGIVHRRLSRRDTGKDVLEKVTLVKDIDLASPVRAHLEILNDFAFENLKADFEISSFSGLHEAWQKRLDADALSRNFYREVADWYFWAHHLVDDGKVELPRDCDTEQEQSLFLIRLLTRIIFCWFLVEKRLVPPEIFQPHRLKELLKDFNPSTDARKPDKAPTYYHAVLQNLFFGTLNMPRDLRGFREKKAAGERYDGNYGVTNLWRHEVDFQHPAAWEALAARVPFLNGGLFDCLDDKPGRGQQATILDGFSDNPKFACLLPNDLFFGAERTVDLSSDYGEKDKKSARSKKARVRGLIEILARYKFTIEENTPLEEEIALDPELLGKVFENLLASFNEDTRTTARKALGAFYTPREIVSYMVDEALKAYLAGTVPRCKGILDDLFSNKAVPRDIPEETRVSLVRAIGGVKILDPACGSGAFPMGALHRLVDLLAKLDPNNESWKRDRLAVARLDLDWLKREDAGADRIADAEARIVDIEKSFDTRFHALDYARKLYLIENAIYGVDIQPVAVQIAKLRFFISLVVDQNVDPSADNLGVRPLPNLETRLVAANTLIPIEKEESTLFSGVIEKLRRELTEIRHEHFNARSPATKRKWRNEDQSKRQEISRHLEQNHMLSKSGARTLAAWDPYNQNASAAFFDSEWMFGLPIGKTKRQGRSLVTMLGNLALVNEAGGQSELIAAQIDEEESGFDVVIGNPPYVRIQTLKKKDPEFVRFLGRNYLSAGQGSYDLYVTFIEAGLRLLKAGGSLAFICPHKFFNSKYGEPLRSLISAGRQLRHVVHFGDQQVFPGASIYTCLLFLSKAPLDECRFQQVEDLDVWKRTLAAPTSIVASAAITKAEWNFAVGKSGGLFNELMAIPLKLSDVVNRVFQGPITSADTVYLFKEASHARGRTTKVFSKQLGQEVELESKLLKRVVRSGEIGRYEANPTALVLFPYEIDGTEAQLLTAASLRDSFPLAWKYLLKNRKVLSAREDSAFDDARWYRFGRTQNLGLWEQPKIMVPYMVTRLAAHLDQEDHLYFVNVTTGGYGITVNPKKLSLGALCAFLNSPILDFCLKRVSSNFRGGYFPANKQYLDQLPIVLPSDREAETLSLLGRIIGLTKQHSAAGAGTNANVSQQMLEFWEQVQNAIIYAIYFRDSLSAIRAELVDKLYSEQLMRIGSEPRSNWALPLRSLYDRLINSTPQLRSMLNAVETFDAVRTIENESRSARREGEK